MIKCPFCGAQNAKNTLFCDECGTYLLEQEKRGTDPLSMGSINWGESALSDPSVISSQSTSPLSIYLNIGPNLRNIALPLNKAIHMGRLDPASDVFPEVDLTNDDGLEKGVSRRHARVLKREGAIVVEDLGSINGTFVNGKRLAPYLPETLSHGDNLQLGRLVIEISLTTQKGND